MPLNLLSMQILQDLARDLWRVARRNKYDNTTTSSSQAHSITARSITVLSPISRLPPELIDIINLYLPASSAIAFRRCNKQLYINGGPEPSNLLYSRLCNDENKDDHLQLLCLLERDAPQRLVCSNCIAMHKPELFSTAQTSKPSESRKCRMVQICPHRNLTFPQLQRIFSTFSTDDGNPQQPLLDCTFENCPTNQSWLGCRREVKVVYEDCSTIWSYKRKWKRKLYLVTAWVTFADTFPPRPEESLMWTWRLCPHVTMKDCCCRVDDPGRIQIRRHDDVGYSRISNMRTMRCKLCRTEILSTEWGELQAERVGRVIIVERYLGQGKSVDDADWILQTTPEATWSEVAVEK